jgi:hypothetical protein
MAHVIDKALLVFNHTPMHNFMYRRRGIRPQILICGEGKNPCPTRESIHSHKIIASHFIYWDTFINRGFHLQSSTLFVSKYPLRRSGLQQTEHCIRGFETHFIQGLCPCMSALRLYVRVGKYHVRRCTVFKSYQLHQTVTVSKLSVKWQGSGAWSVPCYGKDNPKCLAAHNTPVCNLIFCWADPINWLVYVYYTHYFHFRFS